MNNFSDQKVFLLGGTGSIGTFSLKALAITQVKLYGFSFYNNLKQALNIINLYQVQVVYCPILEMKSKILAEFPDIKVLQTKEEMRSFLLTDQEKFTVINGISGMEGLWYTHEILLSGRKLLLANKESLILGGQWILKTKKYPDQLIPIDSEHFSLFVLLSVFPNEWVKSIGITASGGPFLNYTSEELKHIKPKDALKHPIWNMGNNITIGSATLANKGLEILEAKELFGFKMEDIEVRIHPQAQTHAMLFLYNGSWVSHQYFPSMEIPIAQALVFPHMPHHSATSIPLVGDQNYFMPNTQQFPMLELAYEVGKNTHIYQMTYAIANDVANELFMKDKISFTQIAEFVKFNLNLVQNIRIQNVSDILSLKDEILSKTLKNVENFI